MDERHENAAKWVRVIVRDFRRNVIRDAEMSSCRYEETVAAHSEAIFKSIEFVAKNSEIPVATLIGLAFLDVRLFGSEP